MCAPEAPLAQPWNCIIGNVLSAFSGVTMENIFSTHIKENYSFIVLSCAVSGAIFLMSLTAYVASSWRGNRLYIYN
eukprot:UN00250